MTGVRGMRCAAVALVIALLLPTVLLEGRGGAPPPGPLTLFGGAEPTAGTAPALIVEVYYDALRADEYVVLANPDATALDVSGWTLTDGEGTLTFPAGSSIAPTGRIAVAQNSTAYAEDTRRAADFQYGAGSATPMIRTGTFQLNNAGDEVILRDSGGVTIDVIAYDASTYGGAGWTGPTALPVGQGNVARRDADGGWRDTNTSADWDLVRVWSLGQSEFAPASFTFTGSAIAAVTPDAQTAVLHSLLANAEGSIDLAVYTLSSSPLVDDLVAARARFVQVRILLEGAPVGGIDAEEWGAVQRLAGAEVHFMMNNTTLDIQERYRYVHAKYAIIDGRTVVISSENWGPSAFPTWPATGSRGWLVAITNSSLAGYFSQVFAEDFDAQWRDIYTLAEMSVTPVPANPPSPDPRPAVFPPTTITGPFRATPVIGPDTDLADATILGAIRNATRSVHAEVFYAYPDWGPFPDAYLEALLAAARRGVEVRLLLDSSPYNVEDGDPNNNTNTVAYVNGVAAAEGLDAEAKLVNLAVHGFTQVHNKGLVIDGHAVLVSSINWNRNSASANREAGLLLENDDLGGYFESAFAWDWKDDLTPPRADAGPDRTVDAGAAVAFSGLGSSDDVAVTNWSWDLDGDGADDAWGAEVAHLYRQPGRYVARLRVSDAWNNSAEDSAVVTVRTAPTAIDTLPILLAGLAILAVPVLLWFALARRRRQRLSKPP